MSLPVWVHFPQPGAFQRGSRLSGCLFSELAAVICSDTEVSLFLNSVSERLLTGSWGKRAFLPPATGHLGPSGQNL